MSSIQTQPESVQYTDSASECPVYRLSLRVSSIQTNIYLNFTPDENSAISLTVRPLFCEMVTDISVILSGVGVGGMFNTNLSPGRVSSGCCLMCVCLINIASVSDCKRRLSAPA